MKLPTLCLMIGTCIATSSCTGDSQNLAIERQQEIEAEISQQIDRLRKAWGSLDASAVVSFYSENSRDTYNGERFSYTGLVDWASAGYTDVTDTDIGKFEGYRIDVLSANAAVASWHNSVSETHTVETGNAKYIAFMTQVWVREGHGWRILHNHESTVAIGNSD